ncbi:MAG: hypothetical protein K2Y05_06050, partial [Hyphomicrobiaceae bacterium]|nr:hypothetical protein [Hyphomicrobiaceae bacterium]
PGTNSARVLPAASTKSGTVRFSLVAPSTSALTEALSIADIPAPLRPGDALLASIGPARLAGTLGIGARASGRGVDATFDGAIDGGRVHGTLALDGGLQSWRSAPLVANVTVDSPRAERWLEFAGLSTAQTARAIPGRGVVFIRSEGTPETGLSVYSTLSSPDVSAAYQGLVVLPDGRPMQLDGIVAVTARDAADALALSGIAPGMGATGAPVSGQVRLAYAGETVTLETSGLTVGGSALIGKATVTAPGTPSRTVTARLSVDTVSVPGVLAALSDRRSARTDGDDALWPADPLSLSTLDNLSGTIDFTAQRAVIDGAVAVTDLKTTVAVAPGRFSLDRIEAKAHGGTIKGQAVLERMQGGSRFTADATVHGIDAGKLNRGAAIPLSAKVALSGQGASARSIVSALAGSGEVILESGKISGVAPAAVALVADRVLATRELPSMDDVSADVRRGLEGSVLDVKARKLPLKIADGTVRISSPPLETDAGQARFDVTFDLAALRQTHEWRIEARTAPSPSGRVKGLLPPISIVTTGSLAASENWTTNVNLTAFEQELSLRKIERDADELERARKLAEETRLKAEAEEAARLAAVKSAEEEAAKAAASTAASSTAGSATAGSATGAQPGAPNPTQPPSGPASAPTSLPGPPAGVGAAPVPISAPPLPRPPRPNPSASAPRPSDDVFLRPFQSP